MRPPVIMIQRIRVLKDDSILRQKAHKVKSQSKDYISQVEKDLIETLEANSGAGLAAPQIGVSLRMIAYITNERRIGVLINPEIIEASEKTEVAAEGCLSIPGLLVEVSRSKSIKVRSQRGNKWTNHKFSDFEARLIQHEIDHLDGILIVDKAVSLEKFPDHADVI